MLDAWSTLYLKAANASTDECLPSRMLCRRWVTALATPLDPSSNVLLSASR